MSDETKATMVGVQSIYVYAQIAEPQNVGQLRTFDNVCNYSRQRVARPKR